MRLVEEKHAVPVRCVAFGRVGTTGGLAKVVRPGCGWGFR